MKLKKTSNTGGGRQFLDCEADLSGDDHFVSSDESGSSEVGYEASFVDDATQRVKFIN